MSANTPTMIFSVLEHLASMEPDHPSESRSDLTAAIASLSAAFGLSLDDPRQARKLSLKPHTLASVFSAGAQSLGATSASQQMTELQSSDAFVQFVKVVSAKGYFKGVEEGSLEYDERMSKLVAKFRKRTEAASGGPAVEEAGSSSHTPRAVAAPSATPETSDSSIDKPVPASGGGVGRPSTGAKASNEKKAEVIKGEGNKLLMAKDYEGAEERYTEALELSPDGPSSHVYLCNRAAALCYQGRNDDAVVDCQEAIDMNPSYAKAYTRLGYAFFQLEDFEASVKAYKKSLEIEPGNAANTKSLRKAMSKLDTDLDVDDSVATSGSRGAPDLSGLASMMGGAGGGGGGGGGLAQMMAAMAGGGGGGEGGAGGLAGMLNNPGMMAQAQQMMQNPAMMTQVQQMMSNPAMMQRLMGMMGGAGGGEGGSPDLSALAGMMGGAGGGGGTGPSDEDDNGRH